MITAFLALSPERRRESTRNGETNIDIVNYLVSPDNLTRAVFMNLARALDEYEIDVEEVLDVGMEIAAEKWSLFSFSFVDHQAPNSRGVRVIPFHYFVWALVGNTPRVLTYTHKCSERSQSARFETRKARSHAQMPHAPIRILKPLRTNE